MPACRSPITCRRRSSWAAAGNLRMSTCFMPANWGGYTCLQDHPGRINNQGDLVAEFRGESAGRLDAGVGDHADEDHVAYAELLQLQVEVGVGEPARSPVLVHDDVAGLRPEVVVEGAAPGSPGKCLLLGP